MDPILAWQSLNQGYNNFAFAEMKTRILSLVALLAFSSVVQLSATPIILGADELLGTIFPGTPANETNAAAQVLFLVNAYNLGTADGTNLGNNPADPQSEVYKLYRPSAAPASLAAPSSDGKVDTTNPVVSLGGMTYQYVLFFQASNAWVYYIGNIAGSNSIKWGGDPGPNPATNMNGSQISHYVLFNGTTNVPDGGATILLLGLGLLSLTLATRRFRSV